MSYRIVARSSDVSTGIAKPTAMVAAKGADGLTLWLRDSKDSEVASFFGDPGR